MTQKGNQNGLKHGGEGAVKAIQRGESFSGIALEAEQRVRAELANDGIPSIERRNAVRLQAAADLYYQAALGAAEDGNLDKLDKYIARYGWLAGAALRAWSQVQQTERARDKGLSAAQVLEAISAAGDGRNDNESKDS